MADILVPLGITSLIFGGCCSNVFALEAIVNTASDSGTLITFTQFMFTTAISYLTQISPSGRYFVKQNKVPLQRWAIIAAMFCAINVLNNWAFAFKISVPVHIILRSFGSVSTMIAGMIRGKRYSALQVLSVVVLTLGVLISAWADSEDKGKEMSLESDTPTSQFTFGLTILLFAQVLSAYMGAFVEDTYAKYKANWTENLFYSHFFSLPFFLPFTAELRRQYVQLAATQPLNFDELVPKQSNISLISPWTVDIARQHINGIPQGLVYLLINATTQLACISGVNLLSAKSSAVTVTIVLNIRKLVSFILSTLLFGHTLNTKMIVGSALVFGSGALYGFETSWRLPRQRRVQENDSKKNR